MQAWRMRHAAGCQDTHLGDQVQPGGLEVIVAKDAFEQVREALVEEEAQVVSVSRRQPISGSIGAGALGGCDDDLLYTTQSSTA